MDKQKTLINFCELVDQKDLYDYLYWVIQKEDPVKKMGEKANSVTFYRM